MPKAKSSVASQVIEKLQEALSGGIPLRTAADNLAAQMDTGEIIELWAEKGGLFLYDLSRTRIRMTRKSGIPSGYQETAEGYKQDRIAEVMAQSLGVLKDSRLRYMTIGAMGEDDWLGAAANYHVLAEGNQQQGQKCEDLAKVLEPNQTTGDLDPETFTRIWWGE